MLEGRTAGVSRVMEPFWTVMMDTQFYAPAGLTERFTVEGTGVAGGINRGWE